jgi:Macrocin-O-methyltransferase (TylF)
VETRNGEKYLGLLIRTLTNLIYRDAPVAAEWNDLSGFELSDRLRGLDWPSQAHTMVGVRRLENMRDCVESVLADDVPGDIVETGVWRGGVCVLARAVLSVHGVGDRSVWLADSFAGMPAVEAGGYARDHELAMDRHNPVIAVPIEQVMENFRRYDLLDDQVRFLPGWFRDSLPLAPISRIAVLRLDGDLYSSTMDALVHLYPKVSPGGYVIVDDYLVDVCREAVAEYRAEYDITEPIREIDGVGVFWRREPA